MKFGNIGEYKNGWLVGNFEPCLYKTFDNDIGVLKIFKGEKSDGHYHKKHNEYNLIITGKVIIKDKILSSGDIFIYEPYDKSHVEFLEDTTLLVLKNPATKKDKYY